MSLILHCGGRDVSLDELRAMPKPLRMGTKHQPINHARFVDMCMQPVLDAGFRVGKQRFGVVEREIHGRHVPDARFFGIAQLDCELADGVSLVLGFRGSHDQSITRGVCAGESVFVCDNLAFSADLVVLHKHTTNIIRNLQDRLTVLGQKLPEFQEVRRRQIEKMQTSPLSRMQRNDILVTAIEQDALSSSHISAVLGELNREYSDEEAEQFRPGTAWEVYNACTEVAKLYFNRNGSLGIGRTQRLNRVFQAALN